MENLQEFIKQYFSLLNLKKMPDAVKGHYDILVKNKDFPNKDVKSWAKSMDADGEWKDLPKFDSLTDEELRILYADLLETFSRMSGHAIPDEKTRAFVNTYYGDGRLFSVPPIPNDEKQEIKKFLNLLFNDDDVKSLGLVRGEQRNLLLSAFRDPRKLDSPDVRNAIENVIWQFRNEERRGYDLGRAAAKLNTIDLDGIESAVGESAQTVEPSHDDIEKFKKSAPKIFETLFKEKKVYETFKKYEPGDKIISEQLDAAIYDTDYTGKINEANYVAPKYKDRPNIWERASETIDKTYTNVFKKYVTLHRDNITITKTAPAIIKALDKAKIKPTDGLDAIVNKKDGKKDAILGALKGKEPFDAAEHFKWLADRLTAYNDNGMGKAIKGALRNRRKMDQIVTQLVLDAVEQGKTEHAKTALEVLSIMQYGMFTSRTMDAINNTDFTLFSDKGLSWNKNEGIQFVTKALDKTIKTSVKLIGYTATAIANKVFRRPSRVMEKSVLKDKMADMSAFEQEKKKQDKEDNAIIRASKAEKDRTGITSFKQAQKDLKDGKRLEKQKEDSFKNAEAAFSRFKDYENWDALIQESDKIQSEIEQLKDDLRALPNPAPDQNTAFEAEIKKQTLMQKQELLDNYMQQINLFESRHGNMSIDDYLDSLGGRGEYDRLKGEKDDSWQEYVNQQEYNSRLEADIGTYKDAVLRIREAKKRKKERKDKADNWDDKSQNQYAELWAFWDFLQSGKTKNLFHISTKRLQDKMNKGQMQENYDKFYEKWRENHSYV